MRKKFTKEEARVRKLESNRIWRENNKQHISLYNKNYVSNNLDKFRKYKKRYLLDPEKYPYIVISPEQRREYKKTIRKRFLEMYGNKCNCCGETTVEFLTLEHILGQKGKSKKESGNVSYQKAVKIYNPDEYEILCWNCNCSKGTYGICPHKRM